MRDHLDTSQVELARARIAVGLGSKKGRCAARRLPLRPDLTAADATVLLALSDPGRRARIIQCAAAARHGAEIARAVSASARAELAEVIDDETRRFALRHRAKSSETAGGSFAERFAASCADIEALLARRLSGETTPDAALDAALAL